MSTASSTKSLSIFYQNVRGLRSKTNLFQMSVLCSDFDVIFLTETWLIPTIEDSELFSNDYLVHRVDRSPLNSVYSRGGGVLIAVKTLLSSQRITVYDSDQNEIVCVRFCFNRQSFYVCCLYVPPGSNSDVYGSYTAALLRFLESVSNSDSKILIIGDFNLRSESWIVDSDNPVVLLPTNMSHGSENLLNSVLGAGLFQLNHVFNDGGRLLDLVFCSDFNDVNVIKSGISLSRVDIHHPPIEIYFDMRNDDCALTDVGGFRFDYKRTDWFNLCGYLEGVDWSFLRDVGCRLDQCVDRMYDRLLTGLNLFVPRVRCRPRKGCVWFTRAVIRLKNRKSRRFKTWSTYRRQEDYLAYCRAWTELHKEKRRAYSRYLKRTQLDLRRNPERFWSFVNSKRKCTTVPFSMSYNNVTKNGPADVSNLFAEFFKSVYVASMYNAVGDSVLSNVEFCENLPHVDIEVNEIFEKLVGLRTNKSNGCDEIVPIFLKNCAEQMCYPLFYLFNRSLSEGAFPDRWKISHISPIFKTGSRCQVSDYRGVAILPTMGKLFEAIVCEKLTNHFMKYLSSRQHGFVRGRSAETNLLELTQKGLDTIESGRQLDVIYTDFRKAFDRVDHGILLLKLSKMGVNSSMLDWISTYLSNRRQYVLVEGERSQTFHVGSGVPQGSHLGPLLFLIFVNDVVKIFKFAKCLLYADDLKVYASISSIRDAVNLQRDLDSLALWCQANNMQLNIAKCKVLSFHRNTSPIFFEYKIDDRQLERVKTMKDLGLLFDEKFTFNEHIDSIVAKAYSRLGFMKRICYSFDDPYCLRSIYMSLVRSILEYGSIVWNPGYASHSDRIESIQKQFVLYALRRLGWRRDNFVLPSYEDRCRLINLETLANRRNNGSLFFMYDLLNGFLNAPDLREFFVYVDFSERSLRVTKILRVDPHRTNYGFFSPVSRLSILVNKFSPYFLQSQSRGSFRESVRSRSLR